MATDVETDFFDPYTWSGNHDGGLFTWEEYGYTIRSQYSPEQGTLSILVRPPDGSPVAVERKMNNLEREPTVQSIRLDTFDTLEKLYLDDEITLPDQTED